MHLLQRGSSGGKTSRSSSEARMIMSTALTSRICREILSKFCAPSKSFVLNASTAGAGEKNTSFSSFSRYILVTTIVLVARTPMLRGLPAWTGLNSASLSSFATDSPI